MFGWKISLKILTTFLITIFYELKFFGFVVDQVRCGVDQIFIWSETIVLINSTVGDQLWELVEFAE